EARRMREQATASFARRLDTIDDLLLNLDGRLANMSELASVRVEFLNEFLRFTQQLAEDQRDDVKVRRQLGRIHARLGGVYLESRRYSAGDEAFKSAIQFQSALVADYPKESLYRADLAFTHYQHARLLQRGGKLPAAQAAFLRAIELQDAL